MFQLKPGSECNLSLANTVFKGGKPDSTLPSPRPDLTGPPEHHDDTEQGGEEEVPEGLVHPQVPPLSQAVNHLVVVHDVTESCRHAVMLSYFMSRCHDVTDIVRMSARQSTTFWY